MNYRRSAQETWGLPTDFDELPPHCPQHRPEIGWLSPGVRSPGVRTLVSAKLQAVSPQAVRLSPILLPRLDLQHCPIVLIREQIQ